MEFIDTIGRTPWYRKTMYFSIVLMHWIIFSGTMLVILLTHDLSVLVLVNFFLYLALTINLVYGDCPASLLEDKYGDNSMTELLSGYLPFKYASLTRSEMTLQWIFMPIMVVTTKIVILLVKYTAREFLLLHLV
jgi:hypothetical protein